MVVFLITLPAVANEAIKLDDSLYIRSGVLAAGLTPSVAFSFTSVSRIYWHPLTWLSHALDFELLGTKLSGHHLTSILLHPGHRPPPRVPRPAPLTRRGEPRNARHANYISRFARLSIAWQS
jgi:hypothetical protein